jgi:adenylate kinase family enzyme
VPPLDRVVVVGTSGAGKSTFAARLGRRLRRPVFDLDALHWGPDWTPKPPDEFRCLVEEQAAASHWIASGNYGRVRDLLWPRATAIVWLNYGFATVMYRALKRTLRLNILGEELWHGNRESFRRSFLSRESILLWVLTSHHRHRREYAALRAGGGFAGLEWIEFRDPLEAERFLAALPERVA